MKHLGDLFAVLLAGFVMVWLFLLFTAPAQNQPVVLCQPVALIGKFGTNTAHALDKNGTFWETVQGSTLNVDRYCLHYADNWFSVNASSPWYNTGN